MEETKTQDLKEKPAFVEYINQRIEKNKNLSLAFVGATGSGKTYAALRLAEMIDPTFNINRLAFKAKDFMNIVNDLVEKQKAGEDISGSVIVWDESGVEHNAKSFMSISNRVLNYFFQTSRHLNLVVIMTVPLLSFIDSSTRKLLHAIGEMAGLDYKNRRSLVRLKLVQTNVISGKSYFKYLRYKKNGKSLVSKQLKFRLPSKKLVKEYEEIKTQFTSELNRKIVAQLEKVEAKDNAKSQLLTDRQEVVVELLRDNSPEQVAEELEISLTSVYDHKKRITNKGVTIKPIYKDKSIIGHDIKGFESFKLDSTSTASSSQQPNLRVGHSLDKKHIVGAKDGK